MKPVEVLIESHGLIPEPVLFETAEQLRDAVIAALVEAGPDDFVHHTVTGAGDPEERAEELAELDPQRCAEALVDGYLAEGGCVFNDNGDEFRWFTQMEAEGGGQVRDPDVNSEAEGGSDIKAEGGRHGSS